MTLLATPRKNLEKPIAGGDFSAGNFCAQGDFFCSIPDVFKII
jgi:hypothetical protein